MFSKPLHSIYLWMFGTMLASFFILYGLHGSIMTSPNSYLMADDGEAMRIHYVMGYHAQTDSSFVNFEGMNYPFGEHIIYCDAQPIVTNSFKALVHVFPKAVNYAVGFQNVLCFYGLILTALLYFLVFKRWNLPNWFSSLAGIALILIGPQILRMPWQPSLAYGIFFPTLLLLYQSYFRNQHWKNALKIGVTSLIFYFINPYLGVFSTGFFALIFLQLFSRDKWKNKSFYLKGFFSVLLPGVLYQFWGGFTDSRIDRVQLPTGFYDFTSTLSSLFSTPHGILSSFYSSIGINRIHVLQHFEGMAYVGLFTTAILLFILVRWSYLKITKRFSHILTQEQRLLIPIIIIFGILALGIPFTLHPSFEGLLAYFKPLRQLRALGRFSWIFTLGSIIISFIFIYQLALKATSRHWKKILICLGIVGMLFTSIEGVGLHQEIFQHQVVGNPFSLKQLKNNPDLKIVAELCDSVNTDIYQAIVPIPYFHVGSELYGTESHTTYHAMRQVISFAYHKQLPLTASYLSRISRSESMKAFQFFSARSIEKEIKNDFDNRPLLFFVSKHVPSISAHEKRLLALGKVIYSSDEIDLIEVLPQDIWKTNSEEIESWYRDFSSSYKKHGEVYYYSDTLPYYEGFNSSITSNTFGGIGAFEVNSGEKKYFFDQTKTNGKLLQGNYELSFWVETSSNRPQSVLMEDSYAKNGVLIESKPLYEANRTFDISNNWMRWSISLNLVDSIDRKYWLKEPPNQPGILLDECLIRPIGSSVFTPRNDTSMFWNNVPFRVSK